MMELDNLKEAWEFYKKAYSIEGDEIGDKKDAKEWLLAELADLLDTEEC
jgi:hypothetical protein